MKSELSLRTSSDTFLIRKDNYSEISIYRGELTKECIGGAIAKLKMTFQTLPSEFYKILSNRVKDNKFSDDRLKAAVNHVIDNCVYPVPTIAQFISYDKNIKVYTYQDMMKQVSEVYSPFDTYQSVRLRDEQPKPLYAHVNDIAEYNLEIWNKEKPAIVVD